MNKRWNEWVEKIEPDIVILSVGAHIHNEADYVTIVDQVLQELKEMQKARPNIQFAWKTQSPGGCTKKITLPDNPHDAAKASSKYDAYNYGNFFSRDLMLLSRLQQINVPYLDTQMLYSRTDAHISSLQNEHLGDCMHFCVPGPLDLIQAVYFSSC